MKAATILLCIAGTAGAQTFAPYTADSLGTDYLIDTAATGGGDLRSDGGDAIFLGFEMPGLFLVGQDVSITGVVLPLWANNNNPNNNTENGTFTLTFYGLGGGSLAEQYEGLGSETLLGSRTVTFASQGQGVNLYGALFSTPLDFVAESTGFMMRIESTASLRLKRGPSPTIQQVRVDNGARSVAGNGTPLRARLTVLGTAVPTPASAAMLGLAGLAAVRRRR